MKTYFKIACPNCNRVLPVRAEYFGKRVACKFCAHPFIPTPEHVDPLLAMGPAAAASADSNAISEAAQNRIAKLEAELQAACDEATAHAADRDLTLRELETVKQDSARLMDEMQALVQQAEHAAGCSRQASEEWEAEIAGVRGEAEWLQSHVAELREEEAKAKQANAALREELAAAEARLEEFAGTQAERDKLVTGLEEKHNLAEQLRARVAELENAHGEVAAAHGQLIRTQLEARAQWENELQELHVRWEEKHNAVLRSSQEEREAQRQLHATEREQLTARVAELETGSDQGVQLQQGEINRLLAELQESRTSLAELTRVRDGFEEQVRSLEAERVAVGTELDRLRAEHAAAESGVTGGKEMRAALETQVESLRSDIQAREQDLGAARAEVERSRQELASGKQAQQELVEKARLLESEHSSVRANLEKARQELATLAADHAAAVQGAEQGQNEAGRLAEQMRLQRQEFEARELELAALRAERDQLRQQGQSPQPLAQSTHENEAVLQKALEGVSTRTGWPWFDQARAADSAPRAAAQPAASASDDMSRELVALKNDLQRLKRENHLLRQALENFGVQMVQM